MKVLVKDKNCMLLWAIMRLVLNSLVILSQCVDGFDRDLHKVSMT